MKLTPNIGPATRIAYVVMGGVLLIAGVTSPYFTGTLAWVLGAFGAIVILEGAIGF